MNTKLTALCAFLLGSALVVSGLPQTPTPTPPPTVPSNLILAAPGTVTVTLTAAEQSALLYAVAQRDAKRYAEFVTQQAATQAANTAANAKLKAPATPIPFVAGTFVPTDPADYISHRVREVLASYNSQKANAIIASNNALFRKAATVLTPDQQATLLQQLQSAVNAAATPAP